MSDVSIDRSDGVATISLARPTKRNALTRAVLTDLLGMAVALAADRSIQIVLIKGQDPDFCAGADLARGPAAPVDAPSATALPFGTLLETHIHPFVEALHRLPQIVVVSARGHAIGLGFQMLLLADFAIGSETLTLSLPQARLGHTLDHGESWLLPRRVGMVTAMEVSLLGRALSADDAVRHGLMTMLVPDTELEARTDPFVRELRAVAPASLLETKALLKANVANGLHDALSLERAAVARCAATGDFREAMAAFAAKRTPVFTGR